MSLASLIALIFSLLVAPAFPIPSRTVDAHPSRLIEARTRYNMVVNLDYENASLDAKESVVYTNNTSVDLTSVAFNVTPAQFKAFTLNSAGVDGKKVAPVMDGVVMEVPLPELLPKGKAITIELDFRVNVPKRGGRFGVGEGIIALGNWFPIVGVYNESRTFPNERPAGWSKHKYVEVGDAFFTETADFDVTVNTSSPVTIAHTGTLAGKDTNRWQIQAKAVRDFAMAVSNRYQTQSKSVDGVVITAYFLPGHAGIGQQYLDAATQIIVRLNRLVMPYGYPTLHIAEVSSQSSIAQGQEYPNLVYISNAVNEMGGGIDSYLSYLVMHELTHQWFYAMVGDDQVYQPWLDEAFATWFPYHILRLAAPELLPDVWQKRLLDPLADSIRRNGDSPVDKGIYDFADEMHYYNIVYKKGTLFIEELYKTMGDLAFFNAMKDYGSRYKDKIATPIAFFDLFQSHTPQNLNPIIAKYFSYERYKSAPPTPDTTGSTGQATPGSTPGAPQASATPDKGTPVSPVSTPGAGANPTAAPVPERVSKIGPLVLSGDYAALGGVALVVVLVLVLGISYTIRRAR